ncbi:MAG: hypothetical protein IKL55_02760 [Clostridia bacterium]|nr:hypothetical protein [Clostridia bacterium]
MGESTSEFMQRKDKELEERRLKELGISTKPFDYTVLIEKEDINKITEKIPAHKIEENKTAIIENAQTVPPTPDIPENVPSHDEVDSNGIEIATLDDSGIKHEQNVQKSNKDINDKDNDER